MGSVTRQNLQTMEKIRITDIHLTERDGLHEAVWLCRVTEIQTCDKLLLLEGYQAGFVTRVHSSTVPEPLHLATLNNEISASNHI